MTLRARLVLSFSLITLLAIAGGAATVLVTRQRDDATTRSRTASDNQEQTARLRSSYLDQETGYRGYVLTGGTTFLEPFVRGRQDVSEIERRLRADTAAGGRPRRALARVEQAASRWYEAAASDMALVRAGRLSTARARISHGGSKPAFDTVRARLDDLGRVTALELAAARRRSAGTRSALSIAGVLTFGLAIVSLVALAVLVRRWVTVPIRALSGAVGSVRSGGLEEPIALAGPPELASLAADIDAMRQRLLSFATEADRAREATEQNAAVALALGSQADPEPPPLPDGWSLAGEMRAAEGLIAGDTYDFVELHDGGVGLVVVDISGHGAVAGIVALRGKELLRAALALGATPGEAVGTAAAQLLDLGDEVFLSALVAVVDPLTGRISYANAGHPPARLLGEHRAEDLAPTGPILGPFPARWTTATTRIEPGERLAIFTDGVLEARDADRRAFGESRLDAALGARRDEDAATIVRRCLDAVQEFAVGRRLPDDATLVILARAGS